MSTKYKVGIGAGLSLGAVLVVGRYFSTHGLAVLDPKGIVASKERGLFIFAALLSLVVIIPVFTMLLIICLRYNEKNDTATYTPEWDGSRLLETLWWGVPCVIIGILAVVTWNSSHDLDPFKKLDSNVKPITVQVVALDWKWLFIYPEQHIATVNYLQFPEKTPVNFEITSDSAMNSFWIPQLGGQIYAMAGMSTQLHLMSDAPGSYRGSSANLSGDGFSGMKFTAKASNMTDFRDWVNSVKQLPRSLNDTSYAKLTKRSKNVKPAFYGSDQPQLYDTVIHKYMGHNLGSKQ